MSRILTSAPHQGFQGPSMPASHPPLSQAYGDLPRGYSYHTESLLADDSVWDEEEPEEMELSEDEDLAPERPSFTGLFRPSMFKSLLHKAKITTNMGVSSTQPSQQADSHPHDDLFQLHKPEQDFIPCPELFTDVVQKSWSQLAYISAPNGLDKKLYCLDPSLQNLIQLPSVDGHVAQLTSSSVISNDVLDSLRTEDKKAELSFHKTHQAAAWAIRAATSTSFFARASLIWLRQLQERLPPDDCRLHQDINKIVAATEYSADVSLNAAKFASRALVLTVTSRRLVWLCHWRANLKSKWKLASAPYKGSFLFGRGFGPNTNGG
ncbi:lamina-associated polypeptide 2-like isoform X2 [Pantherophis guttatus]|uniref:Lamina-associated polypeptide 2-like isoform X2 n=1 Tax=Pantherophis guttatus TaxID=94885 RepID=A0ABM3Z2F8_PANGU|nr:lamina-associated polypeptide 2-like isoform X2 [Pantherophis guttatus]